MKVDLEVKVAFEEIQRQHNRLVNLVWTLFFAGVLVSAILGFIL